MRLKSIDQNQKLSISETYSFSATLSGNDETKAELQAAYLAFLKSAEAIVKESQGVLAKEIFLCGPPPMMKALKEQFGKWKVPVANIHSEEFSIN